MKSQKIEALYAWVAQEPDGGEGVCSASFGNMHHPLVGADFDRIESYRDHARFISKATGCPVRLVRFSQREDLEELEI